MCDLNDSSQVRLDGRDPERMKGSADTATFRETVVAGEDVAVRGIVLDSLAGFVPIPSKMVVPGESMTVGRARQCELSFPMDKKLSRIHFSIECKEGHGIVRDLGSTNGTSVNGRITDEALVYDGDHIIAGMTNFTVRLVAE